MTICPIAIAIGCKKCPVFKICPVKTSLGDAPKASDVKPAVKPAVRAAAKSAPARKKAKK